MVSSKSFSQILDKLYRLDYVFLDYSIAGTMGIVFPYLGEFQPTKYREKILCWMELFWTIGIIILPGEL